MNAVSKANGIVAIRLKKAIKDKGIKQTVIAEKTQMTAQELSDMLNGRRIIKVIDIQKLLEVLGEFNVDANYLFGIEEVKKMKISENEYLEIRVVGSDNELIASITDTNIIVLDGYKVVCVSDDD